MTKEIRLNAFDMNCVGHIQHGMWTHPRDRSTEYNTIRYWQDLARLAERGKFDGIFLADIVGVYDVYRGGPAPSIVDAVQIPVNDPMMVVPVMAAVTEHIGFGVTANLTYEPPYLFARRMSTLDHLTRGRVGWNIVTGYLDSAARGMGLAAQPDHDRRYDEDTVELPLRVPVNLQRIDATDQIGAVANGRIEQVEDARTAHHAALRERNDLHQ